MILQIDCEGCEWISFRDMPQEILEKFSQIIVEYHIGDLNNYHLYKLITTVLKKINLTHQSYHIRINNCGSKTTYGNFHKFGLLEVSYVRKKGNIFKNDYDLYPINGLDYKNCPKKKNYNYGLAGFFSFE